MANSATEPKTCRHPAIGSVDPTLLARKGDQYATRHNPFVYFHSIIDSPACASDVVDLDQLAPGPRVGRATPNLVFITPNLCHDGHDAPCVDGEPGGLASADQFLCAVGAADPRLARLHAGRDARDHLRRSRGVRSDADSSSCCNTPPDPNIAQPGGNGPGGGRIGAVVVSVASKPGTTDATAYNHYGLLCSIEDVFGLSHLGFAGAPGMPCFGTDVYNG